MCMCWGGETGNKIEACPGGGGGGGGGAGIYKSVSGDIINACSVVRNPGGGGGGGGGLFICNYCHP